VRNDRQRLDELQHRAGVAIEHRLNIHRERLFGSEQRISSLNPIAILERGFAVVSHPDGRTVLRVEQVKPGDPLSVLVSNGEFDVQVSGSSEG
jgi:exodeoxyribonuclease VII large subunit